MADEEAREASPPPGEAEADTRQAERSARDVRAKRLARLGGGGGGVAKRSTSQSAEMDTVEDSPSVSLGTNLSTTGKTKKNERRMTGCLSLLYRDPLWTLLFAYHCR
jgi:hypothetical protein